jgi:PAS domain S-box-containing protein
MAETLAGHLPPLGARLPLAASILMGITALVAVLLGAPDLLPLLFILVAAALVNLGGAALVRRGLWPEIINPALRISNLTAVSLAVLFYGRLNSPLILLYVEEIASASLRDGRAGASKGWGLATAALGIVTLCSRPLTTELGLRYLLYASVLGVIALILGQMGQQRIEIQAALARQTLENARLLQSVQEHAANLSALAADLAWEKSRRDAILHNIADGLLVTDLQGVVLLVNPAFENFCGQASEALLGCPLPQAIHDQTLQRLVASALDEQTAIQTADLSLPDGRIFRAYSSVVREATCALGVVTVLHDITHQVELDRIKTDFIAVVSHELRTPLTSVLGFAKLIQKNFERHISPQFASDDRKSQRAVQRISDNLEIIVSEGERLTRLINDVLDIAKMEAGKIEWHPAAISLSDVVHRAATAVSALAQAKSLELRVEVQENLPAVWADRDRLTQVVTNLLSNAIKFTDSGHVQIRAYHLQTPHPRLEIGDWLVVSVQDTGIGIAPDQVSQVFEKFKRVHDTATGRQGTGLGLPISKEIIEHHGGHIWIESELGAGSAFTFALPVKENS